MDPAEFNVIASNSEHRGHHMSRAVFPGLQKVVMKQADPCDVHYQMKHVTFPFVL